MTTKNLSNNQTTIKTCSIEGCQNKQKSKGLCRKHHRIFIIPAGGVRLCSIEGCEQIHLCKDLCNKHHRRLIRYGNPMLLRGIILLGDTLEERFWSQVKKNTNEKNCWEWQGRLDREGYGHIWSQRRHILVHRFSWFLVYGKMPDLHVLHSCDNRKCVNPSHLFQGTQIDNNRDRDNKNRQSKGEGHFSAKLNNASISEIRDLISKGVNDSKIGRRFGVNSCTIGNIRKGKTWRHIK